jgi:hypothetical protein
MGQAAHVSATGNISTLRRFCVNDLYTIDDRDKRRYHFMGYASERKHFCPRVWPILCTPL